jgi:hypothetical protein
MGPVEASWLLLTGIGLAAAAGLNAYIPLLIAGLLTRFEIIDLAAPYDLLASTPALGIVAVLLAVELLADKIPAVDSLNDVAGTVMRPASGALLFAGALGGDAEWVQALGLIAGLVTAGAVHGAKAPARPVVNVSTAGAGGPVMSVVEDITSVVLTVAAIFFPLLVVVLIAGMVWLLVRLRRRWRRSRAGVGAEPVRAPLPG